MISKFLNMQKDHQGNDIRLARFENSLSITKKGHPGIQKVKPYYHFDNKAIIRSESKQDCYEAFQIKRQVR